MNMKSKCKNTMYCQVCGKPFDIRDQEQALFHDLECEPEEVYLPEDAHYARLEDEMPSITPMEIMQVQHPLTFEKVLSLIKKVTSSL